MMQLGLTSTMNCKSGKSKCNPYWVILLVSSLGTNYILNEHEDFCHYGPYAMPSKMIPWCSHPACFVNQNDILIQLSCKQNYMPLIMSLTGIKILTNMAHMRYRLSWCHVAAILQVWSVKIQSLLCYRAHLALITFLTLIMSLRYCSI